MLTPRECARLQGFPETFKPHPTRSAAYKQFGNAVPVPLVQAVARKMLEALETGEHLVGQTDSAKTFRKYGGNQKQEYKAGIDRPALLAS